MHLIRRCATATKTTTTTIATSTSSCSPLPPLRRVLSESQQQRRSSIRHTIVTTTSCSPSSIRRTIVTTSRSPSTSYSPSIVTTSCSPSASSCSPSIDTTSCSPSSTSHTIVTASCSPSTSCSPSSSIRRTIVTASCSPSLLLQQRRVLADSPQQRSSIRRRRRAPPCGAPLPPSRPPLCLPFLWLHISMAPPVYAMCSVDDCMALNSPLWPRESFLLQQEASSCSGSSRTRVRNKSKVLGRNNGDEDLEEEEEEAGGVIQRMMCANIDGAAGDGLNDEGRGSSSASGGGGAGRDAAGGMSQSGGREEAAAASVGGGAGGENQRPRDGVWFRITDSCSLALHRGDITKWFVDGKTDAIANAANEAMLGGGGVDGAIHKAAGPKLLAACYEAPEVTTGVRCPTGSAVITGGFNLPASKVVHTVGPIYDNDEVSAEPLAKAYRSSVTVATEAGVKYIAFPAISCGVYGYPHKKAAKIAIQTLKESSGGLLEVHFVLFSESTWNAWLEEAKAGLGEELPQVHEILVLENNVQPMSLLLHDKM